MYGCGIGPVSLLKNRKTAGRIIDRYADIITLRDPQSAKELQDMGVTKPEIRVTADPALLLDAAPADKVDSFLLSQGIEPGGKYAMFCLRPWKGVEDKLPLFAAQAKELHEKGITPVFFALEPKRDMEITRKAAAMANCPHHVIAAPHDGHLIVGLMGRMELLVSMRLHALIFAAGQGVPLVGVVYDPKVSGFLNYLGQNRYVELNAMEKERLCPMTLEALGEGRSTYSAEKLRGLARENETAARRLLEEEV